MTLHNSEINLDKIIIVSIDGPIIHNLKIEKLLNSKQYISKTLEVDLKNNTWSHTTDYTTLHPAFGVLGITDTKIKETYNIGSTRKNANYMFEVLGVYDSTKIEHLNRIVAFTKNFEIKKAGFEELLKTFNEN